MKRLFRLARQKTKQVLGRSKTPEGGLQEQGCPCGGRHYPSDDACRWCKCHDPRNAHHGASLAWGLMQAMKTPPAEDSILTEYLYDSGKAQGFGSYGPHLQRMADQEKRARWHDWNSCQDPEACVVHGDPEYRRMRAKLAELDPGEDWDSDL